MKNSIIVDQETLEELVREFRALQVFLERKNQSQPLPETLRTSDVKKILKIKDSTLATLRNNGTIPFFKAGGTILFLKEDIIKLIKNNYSGTDEIKY